MTGVVSTDFLRTLAIKIRRDILRATTAAGSGHPTSSLSATDLMAGLVFGGAFHADLKHPDAPDNDRLIFSKGHAAPLLYALYAAAGKIHDRELLALRTFSSPLEGHPSTVFPFVDIPTGSLGQGLSAGVGIALAARMQKRRFRTYVLLGDGEMAEGSVWEAMQVASHEHLGSLVGVLDVNRLGQSGATMLGWNLRTYARRCAAFGWNTIMIDGHVYAEILKAYRSAALVRERPTMIIAKTVKGKGVSFLENVAGWHGRVVSKDRLSVALAEIGEPPKGILGTIPKPVSHASPVFQKASRVGKPQYPAEAVALRAAFGNALVRLTPLFPELCVLDGDVKNSTQTDRFAAAFPKRFFESYIAEQNMIGVANGLASRGILPVVTTFSAFLTRGFDQLRMAQYAGTHQVYIGTHAGVAVGPDGPSQMGLEDIAMFRTLQTSVVLAPADAYATERLTECALRGSGIMYLRLLRNSVPILYTPKTVFTVGGSKTLLQSQHDLVTLVGSGMTVFFALAAAGELAKEGIRVRVIDCYSVKPIDVAALKRAARETTSIIVAEDHVEAGGVSDAVRVALGKDAGKVVSLAVKKLAKSGMPAQLFRYEGIDAAAIVRSVKKLLRRTK